MHEPDNIDKVLEKNGYKVVWNKSGSNLINAATTLILNHTNPITKKLNGDILLMELDESFISRIFEKNTLYPSPLGEPLISSQGRKSNQRPTS